MTAPTATPQEQWRAVVDRADAGNDTEQAAVRAVLRAVLSEEQGGVDELDYCEICILERAPALVAAGSTAEYVAGLPQGPVLAVDARRNLTGRLLELRDQWSGTSEGQGFADALTDLLEEFER